MNVYAKNKTMSKLISKMKECVQMVSSYISDAQLMILLKTFIFIVCTSTLTSPGKKESREFHMKIVIAPEIRLLRMLWSLH